MKRFLSTFAIALLVFSLAGFIAAPSTTHADEPVGMCTTDSGAATVNIPMTQKECQDAHGVWSPNVNGTEKTGASLKPSTCGISNIFSCLSDLILLVPGWAASYILMPLMSLLVYTSGMLLNWSMEYSVVNMAQHFGETNIEYIWSVMRDLVNMGFIFVLIYTAIMTAFSKPGWERAIKNIVISAILINFSLLATKAVIDASNVLAMLFYNAITPGGTTTTMGIGASFMQVLNIQTLYDLTHGIEGTKMAIIGIAGSAIYLITSISFLSIAAMFLVRFVALIFVLALSPVYALGAILPQAEGYADQWLKTLLNQAFFAPLYFALTWIALKVAEGLLAGYQKDGGTLNYASAILGDFDPATGKVKASPSSIGTLVMFVIIIALILGALSAAKSMAEKGHPMMKQIMGKATKGANDLFYGAAIGGAGRNLFGRYGAGVASDPNVIARANQKGMAGALGRLQLSVAKKAASSSFDARNAGLAVPEGIAKSNFGRNLGLDKVPALNLGAMITKETGTGEGFKGGFKEQKDARDKEDRERKKAADEELRKAENKRIIEAGKDAPAGSPEHTAMLRRIKDMSDKDITSQRPEFLARPDIAQNLTGRHLTALSKAVEKGDMSETDFDTVKKAHFEPIENGLKTINDPTATAADIDTAKKAVAGLSNEQIKMAPAEYFDPSSKHGQAFIGAMTDTQIKAVLEGDKLTADEKKKLRDERARPLAEAFNGRAATATAAAAAPDPAKAAEILSKMSPESLAKVDAAQLGDDAIVTIYTPSRLNQMANVGGFDQPRRTAIRDALDRAARADATISNALNQLQTTPPPDRVTRDFIISALSPEQKNIVRSVMWLDSDMGQQLF